MDNNISQKLISVTEDPAGKPEWRIFAILLAFVVPCLGCYLFSTYIEKVGQTESLWLFAEIIYNLLWISFAGILWASRFIIKPWNKKLILMYFVLLLVLTAGEMWVTALTFRIKSLAFFSPILIGSFLSWTLFEKYQSVLEFEQDSVIETANFQTESKIIDSGENLAEVIEITYVFQDRYTGKITVPQRGLKDYRKAIQENRLRVDVQYLPRDPKIHKLIIDL
jgi:hypothetical protein